MAHKVEEDIERIIEKLEALEHRLAAIEGWIVSVEVNLETLIKSEVATATGVTAVQNFLTTLSIGVWLAGAGIVASLLGLTAAWFRRRRRARR